MEGDDQLVGQVDRVVAQALHALVAGDTLELLGVVVGERRVLAEATAYLGVPAERAESLAEAEGRRRAQQLRRVIEIPEVGR